jgi:putative ABC transport system substrate-binding protein
MICRRDFITLLGGAAAWPLVARGQQRGLPVIGLIIAGSPDAYAHLVAAFRQGLGQNGYIEGRNIAIDYRFGQDQPERLPELAIDLVRRQPKVIAAPGGVPALRAVRTATALIPIVFGISADPVQLGLVASLNRPGGNMTGFATMNSEITTKRLSLLRELLPGAARFALLVETNSVTTFNITDLQAAASSIGGNIEVLNVAGTVPDLDAAFANLAERHVEALLLNASTRFYGLRSQIAAMAVRHAMPTMHWDRALAEAGGLISYGTDEADIFRQVGIYVGRILNGEKAADLPVQQPTKFELVINAKAAKALGLDIPLSLQLRADDVIE